MYLLLFPIGIALMYITSIDATITEYLYSKAFFVPIARLLNMFSSLFPFSILEISIFVFIFLFLFGIINALLRCSVFRLVKAIAIPLGIVYLSFVLLWGINYNRLPFAKTASLEVKESTVYDLSALCEKLIADANKYALECDANSLTTTTMYKSVFNRADKGYIAIEDKYNFIPSKYFAKPKPVLLSPLMNYTGITGIYSPFTGEANINVAVPYTLFPSTACHEMAHQRGFAREDEANFISYLVCIAHEDFDFKYSGTMLALSYSMSALYHADATSYQALVATYSEKVHSDFNFSNKFWAKYDGPVNKASEKVNDTYLKTNLQENGIKSYGAMVDLLLAYYK